MKNLIFYKTKLIYIKINNYNDFFRIFRKIKAVLHAEETLISVFYNTVYYVNYLCIMLINNCNIVK